MVSSMNKALMPKEYTAKATTGNNAQTTFCMIVSVLLPLTMCGDVLIFSVLFSI